MKRCPACKRVEPDNSLAFCRVDGTALITETGPVADVGTAKFNSAPVVNEIETTLLPHRTDADLNRSTAPTTVLPAQPFSGTTNELSRSKLSRTVAVVIGAIVFIAIVAGSVYWYLDREKT